MPNHFHFLVEIKNEKELEAFFIENAKHENKKRLILTDLRDLSGLEREKYFSKKICLQFSHFFNSYTKAFNKQNSRMGGLFIRPFKRLKITDEKYRLNLVKYIHQNPIEAGLVLKPEDWEHSSFLEIINRDSSWINHQEVVRWFEDLDNFKYSHRSFISLEELAKL